MGGGAGARGRILNEMLNEIKKNQKWSPLEEYPQNILVFSMVYTNVDNFKYKKFKGVYLDLLCLC